MQQLYFHPTWERAISEADREVIEQLFEQTYDEVDDTIMSPTVRAAFNHKGELLVTALVHNFTHHSARFRERTVFVHADDDFYEQRFTIDALVVPPFTSMPWTFIFPPNALALTITLSNVYIEIE